MLVNSGEGIWIYIYINRNVVKYVEVYTFVLLFLQFYTASIKYA